ncbi:GGDEF domain-containing protein [Pseudoalteromonas rubra]|uniref:diguanylate cyclase n=1 Tax=Pseudoalteromonas rubra TaxID=43658 RepID=A0A5S3WK53_9GAMM|nr:GGDEF domain-containing protein [Pseudoalteromonas rubra]TMP27781.1 GGDEF domain-containing protein [Pseudoalteromonas rubra]TMP32508.1 GGDEF domain-containing protein [Pseudoalteromonas rubra]
MRQKLLLTLIWLTTACAIVILLQNPAQYAGTIEELIWLAVALTVLVLSLPHLKYQLLLYAWITYCVGLILDLFDDLMAIEFIPVNTFDTSLKHLGFMLVCYGLHTIIQQKKETILALNKEIARRHELEQQLKFDATHDELTGLGNRRACFERFEPLCENSSYLYYFDLDNFKLANDCHGHHTGDEILKKVAQAMSRQFTADACFRIGGDEFVAFTNEANLQEETLRAMLLEEVFEYGVGVSIGKAAADPTQDPDALLHQADLSMYENKAGKSIRTKIRKP